MQTETATALLLESLVSKIKDSGYDLNPELNDYTLGVAWNRYQDAKCVDMVYQYYEDGELTKPVTGWVYVNLMYSGSDDLYVGRIVHNTSIEGTIKDLEFGVYQPEDLWGMLESTLPVKAKQMTNTQMLDTQKMAGRLALRINSEPKVLCCDVAYCKTGYELIITSTGFVVRVFRLRNIRDGWYAINFLDSQDSKRVLMCTEDELWAYIVNRVQF